MTLQPRLIRKFYRWGGGGLGCGQSVLLKPGERCKVDICLPRTDSLVIHHNQHSIQRYREHSICHSNSPTCSDPAENRKSGLVRNFIIISPRVAHTKYYANLRGNIFLLKYFTMRRFVVSQLHHQHDNVTIICNDISVTPVIFNLR